MLSKSLRLPVQSAFKRRGNTFRASAFTLRVLPAEGATSRFGIAVGRTVSKSAVVRNRLKRIFFSIAAKFARTLPCRDYLAIALPGAGALTQTQLAREVEELFSKVSRH